MKTYCDWIQERFPGVHIKVDGCNEHVFPRLCLKIRKQLVALDRQVDLSKGAQHLSPKEWAEYLDQDPKDWTMLDVRNHYEWKVGRFKRSEPVPCSTFREFPSYIEQWSKGKDKSKPLLMQCTGGIRCEFFSPLLRELGFKQIYQLRGGSISYAHEVGDQHWEGALFVFDDRVVVPMISDRECTPCSTCLGCNTPTYHYFNCANVECNAWMLMCRSCYLERKGCCSPECSQSPRVRAIDPESCNRPFRRLSPSSSVSVQCRDDVH